MTGQPGANRLRDALGMGRPSPPTVLN